MTIQASNTLYWLAPKRPKFFVLITLLWSILAPALAQDITPQLQDIGNKPQQAGMRGLALNIWDMVEYQGKVFIGMGNTTTNAGPIPVWAYDHVEKTWDITPETIIDQEAIERFRLIDGDLYIPSSDPKGRATDQSKFYRRDPQGTWTHYSSLDSLTAHIRDLAHIDGWLIGVGNSRSPHRAVEGETGTVKVPLSDVQRFSGGQWPLAKFESAIQTQPDLSSPQSLSAQPPPIDVATTQRNRVANWFFATFELHDGLYASTRWMGHAPLYPEPTGLHFPPMDFPPNVPPFPHLVRWSPDHDQWIAPEPQSLDRLIPECLECDPNLILYPHKPVLFGDLWWGPIKSYGLMAEAYRSAYNQSLGLIVKPKTGPGRWVALPHKGAIAEDIEISDQTLYLLANQPLHASPKSPPAASVASANPREASRGAEPSEVAYQVLVYALSKEQATAALLNEQTGIKEDAWQTVLTFQSANPVRSFLKIGEDWYFGVGVNQGEPVGGAGRLLHWSPTP